MAQVTIYLPDDVERLVRREARKAKKSLSAYLSELAASRATEQSRRRALERLAGSWEGRFPEFDRLPDLDEPVL